MIVDRRPATAEATAETTADRRSPTVSGPPSPVLGIPSPVSSPVSCLPSPVPRLPSLGPPREHPFPLRYRSNSRPTHGSRKRNPARSHAQPNRIRVLHPWLQHALDDEHPRRLGHRHQI